MRIQVPSVVGANLAARAALSLEPHDAVGRLRRTSATVAELRAPSIEPDVLAAGATPSDRPHAWRCSADLSGHDPARYSN